MNNSRYVLQVVELYVCVYRTYGRYVKNKTKEKTKRGKKRRKKDRKKKEEKEGGTRRGE